MYNGKATVVALTQLQIGWQTEHPLPADTTPMDLHVGRRWIKEQAIHSVSHHWRRTGQLWNDESSALSDNLKNLPVGREV